MNMPFFASSDKATTLSSGGGSASACFFNVPPTQDYGSVSDGYVRLASVAPVSAALRQRFRPIYQPGQSRYVSGPQNAGDSETRQASQGGGSLATMGQGSSGG